MVSVGRQSTVPASQRLCYFKKVSLIPSYVSTGAMAGAGVRPGVAVAGSILPAFANPTTSTSGKRFAQRALAQPHAWLEGSAVPPSNLPPSAASRHAE